jgi:hypothetical protein
MYSHLDEKLQGNSISKSQILEARRPPSGPRLATQRQLLLVNFAKTLRDDLGLSDHQIEQSQHQLLRGKREHEIVSE